MRIVCFENPYLKEDHPIGYLQENLTYQLFLVSTFHIFFNNSINLVQILICLAHHMGKGIDFATCKTKI